MRRFYIIAFHLLSLGNMKRLLAAVLLLHFQSVILKHGTEHIPRSQRIYAITSSPQYQIWVQLIQSVAAHAQEAIMEYRLQTQSSQTQESHGKMLIVSCIGYICKCPNSINFIIFLILLQTIHYLHL